MTDHRAVQLLRSAPELAELAAYPFNFDLDRAEHLEAVHLASGLALTPVAGDDTGGTYFVCADGALLYADSEGGAGLLADSLDEALEILIGLPGWHDLLGLDPAADDATLQAAFAETEADQREYYGPDLDADRTRLLTALGLPRTPAPELIRRLDRALRRTEPDYLLLNSEELCAHAPLDRRRGPEFWQTLPAPAESDGPLARAALARRQGRTESARCVLIRLLDDAGPRDEQLPADLAEEFTLLGDTAQAARARRLCR